MAAVITGVRWSLLGTGSGPESLFFLSAAIAVLMLIGGMFYFRRMERQFADVI